MDQSINKKILALTLGGVMSLMSIPSATTVTIVGSTVASFALTTDAYADKKIEKSKKWKHRKPKKPSSGMITAQEKICTKGKKIGGFCVITPPPKGGCPKDFPLQPGGNPPYCRGDTTEVPDAPNKPTGPGTPTPSTTQTPT